MKSILLSLTVFVIHFNLFAQPGTLDMSFNSTDAGLGKGDGASSILFHTRVLPDNKIIIGGNFFEYNGNSCDEFARLNADGTFDHNFKYWAYSSRSVTASAIQSDGKLLIAGLSNESRDSIMVRLKPDGNYDYSFATHIASKYFYGRIVNVIAIQKDGKIIIGGLFDSINGQYVQNLARLNIDGSLDKNFISGKGPNNEITSVYIQPDGKVLISGNFDTLFQSPVKGITRLNNDGSPDQSFNAKIAGLYPRVNIKKLYSNGNILIDGIYDSINGIKAKSIDLLSSSGSVVASFKLDSNIQSARIITTQSTGKVIGVGKYQGSGNSSIFRLNTNGTIDSTFRMNLFDPKYNFSADVQSDDKIIIAGWFGSFAGITKPFLLRLNADGSFDYNFNKGSGINGKPMAMCIQDDDKIVVGGDLIALDGQPVKTPVRILKDGTADPNFNVGQGALGIVNALAYQKDGKILVGGEFEKFNDKDYSGIVRLLNNGEIDTGFAIKLDNDSRIYSIHVQHDEKIILSGYLKEVNGITMKTNLIRLNKDGSIDSTFNIGIGPDNGIKSIDQFDNGKILIGGYFNKFNGISREKIVILNEDGTTDTSFKVFGIADYSIYGVNILNDSSIIAYGTFLSFNGAQVKSLVKLNLKGEIDKNFSTQINNGDVYSLFVQPDGKIIIGSSCGFNCGNNSSFLQRINPNGTLDPNFKLGKGPNKGIVAIDMQSDGKLILLGGFTEYDGVGRNHIARLNNCIVSSMPKISASENPICKGSSTTLHLSKGILFNGTGWNWYSDSCGGTLIKTDTAITVTPGSSETYYVQAQGSCASPGLCNDIEIIVEEQNIDTTVNASNGTLTALHAGLAYQWLDCDNGYSPVAGAIGQTYTPDSSGTFAVQLTKGVCTTISGCHYIEVVGIKESYNNNFVKVYPNPSKGIVKINLKNQPFSESEYILYNLEGEKLKSGKIDSQITSIDINTIPDGIYYLWISDRKKHDYFKIVKI